MLEEGGAAPVAQPVMVGAVGQPVMVGAAVVAEPTMVHIVPESNVAQGQWSSDLCACCNDCNTCCAVIWIPCVPLGQLAHQFDIGARKPSCKMVAGVLGLLYILGRLTQAVGQQAYASAWEVMIQTCAPSYDPECMEGLDLSSAESLLSALPQQAQSQPAQPHHPCSPSGRVAPHPARSRRRHLHIPI